MQLTINYRPQEAGVSGSKNHYLDCHVDFTREDRAVIDERGLYDLSASLPPATPLPTRSGDFLSMAMRIGGIILAPLGLLSSCVQVVKPAAMAGAGIWPAFMLIAGVALFTIGKLRDIQAQRREVDPVQRLTLRRLLTQSDFVVYADDLLEAQQCEEEVRQSLASLAERLRTNTAVPNQTTYEL
jgi:hypothetical protein